MKIFAAKDRGVGRSRLRSVRRVWLLGFALVLCAGCALPSRVYRADTLEPGSATVNLRMFDRVDELVRTRHYSRDLNGVDWAALVSRYRPLVAASADEREAYRRVNAMLSVLNDSHTYAYRPVRSSASSAGKARNRHAGRREVSEVEVLADGVVYVRFDYFDRERLRWLVREVNAHRDAPGMILDLRYNNGGLIVSAQRAVGLFFRKRVSMGIVGHRNGRRSTEYSRGSGRYFGPLAVLVGPDSHSSAEVFAYVMQAHDRATVIGQVTAGEVLGSRRFPLPDGGQLQLSVSDYRCLNGQRLEGRGVEPDVITPVIAGEATKGMADAAIASAMQILKPGTRIAQR